MFSNLQKARFIKRYKRFLADVAMENGEKTTVYCPNTGAMTNCAEKGDQIWLSESDNPKRKYKYTWELTHRKSGHWICVNTARANQLVSAALQSRSIAALAGYRDIRAEVKYGSENSRIDFLLRDENRADCYVEVKSCTLLETDSKGFFPDAVTKRGQKHLRELIEMKARGFRSVLLFAVLHTGIKTVAAAGHIDKEYALLFEQAINTGVEILCFYPEIRPAQYHAAEHDSRNK